jgi:ribosomal protein S18 acetylase RimI-like enzyme
MLAEYSLAALRAAGIDKCHLFVLGSNSIGLEFWRKIGWKERVELIVFSKDA